MNRLPSYSTTDENVERVREIMCADRQLITGVVTSDLGISHGSIHSIHDHLKMKNVVFDCTWLSFKLLPEQKEMKVNMSRDLIDMVDADDSFLKRISSVDEAWFFLNHSEAGERK
ncbi:hypothetical protein TNIN_297111 [Trichonephila inaurata madagascariensis]|uniref:Uncharacterized protein n=1 Tax=Trichonephila inaurata madagascariensis TaxID=2747483 RepID=A0A8X7C746_9ARAC|nr:hypothetical protein TNIN_297111 [Trichonephila inaurata madagascariensis]